MERLIEQLGSRKHSIIFLKGSPGSGKSSLISQLAYETPTIINLRYHAFKPITPEIKEIPPDAGRTVDPRVFWTALIDQIRVEFTGKLYQYKVPIRCDYLTVDEIRSHTLRLAQELSNINHRPTVIAVDGIDHALEQDTSLISTRIRSFCGWFIPKKFLVVYFFCWRVSLRKDIRPTHSG